MTLADKAIAALRAAGLDAKKPAAHPGKCRSPYLVVQEGTEQPTGRTTVRRSITVYGYAPASSPLQLQTLLTQARAALAALPALTLNSVGEELVDDSFEALWSSINYTALCAVRR